MRFDIQKALKKIDKEHRRRNKWYRIVSALAAVVVFCTVYALILPALTLENDQAAENGVFTEGRNVENTAVESEDITVDEAAPAEEEAVTEETVTEEAVSEEAATEEAATEEETSEEAVTEETEEAAAEEQAGEVKDGDEEKADASAEKTEEAASKAMTFTESTFDNDVTVKVEAEAGAFPEGTTMKVKPVAKRTVIDAIDAAIKEEVESVKAVDITFYDKDGNEIEPAEGKTVNVTITSRSITSVNDPVVIHIKEDNGVQKGEVVKGIDTNDQSVGDISFRTDDFSIYAIVGTETITSKIITADGSTYEVSVTYDAEAGIPKGSTLQLKEFAESSAEYKQAKEKVDEFKAKEDAAAADGKASDSDAVSEDKEEEIKTGLSALDISILDADGNKVEPANDVKVSIEMKSLPKGFEAEDIKATMEVHHLTGANGNAVEKVAAPLLEGSRIAADKNGATAEFTTDSFSTYVVTWGNRQSVTLHFVDDKGNVLSGIKYNGTTINDGQTTVALTSLITSNNSDLNLINAFTKDGYTYSNTYLNNYKGTGNPVGTCIGNELHRGNNSSTFQYRTAPNSADEWQWGRQTAWKYTNVPNNSDIYLVYSSVPGSSGGGGEGGGDSQAPDLGEIGNSKEVTSNGDGTYDVALSVAGTAQNKTEETDVNVIFVVDTSGSMEWDDGDGNPKIDSTKTAVKAMAAELLSNNTTANNDAVELALISFNRTATTVPLGSSDNYWTTNNETFANAVGTNEDDGITTSSGTNWEEGLQKAESVDKGDGDPTYVIFFTDGAPTQYQGHTPSSTYYEDGESLWAARDEARRLVNSGKYLYGIFAYGDEDNTPQLSGLVEYAYNDTSADDTYFYDASDTSAVEDALAEILDTINMNFAYADVKVHDGITGLTSVTFEDVDPESFRYKITYKDYTSSTNYTEKTVNITVNNDGSITIPSVTYGVLDNKAADGWKTVTTEAVTINGATYDDTTKAVNWDMKKTTGTGDAAIYMLEDTWNYEVKFKVWPSQESYDLVAALNNGLVAWGSDYTYTDSNGNTVTIPAADYQKQIVKNGDSYSLKTNTDANVKYKQVTETIGEDGKPTYSYGTETTATIDYTGSMALDGIEIKIIKQWDTSLSTEDYDNIASVDLYVLEDNPDATGFDKTTASTYYKKVTLTKANNWEAVVAIAPGVYDGTSFKTTGHTYSVVEPDLDKHYEFTMTPTHPMLNGTTHDDLTDMVETYNDSEAPYADMPRDNTKTTTYTVKNTLKGGINIKKVIDVDDDLKAFVNEDQEFSFTIKLYDENNNPVYTEGSSDGGGALGTRIYKEDGTTVRGTIGETGEVTLSMKASESMRIVNVPAGTYYTVTEGDLSATVYEIKQNEWLVRHKATATSEEWITDDSETLQEAMATNSHKIYPNAENNVTFTNTYVGTGYVGTKVGEDNNSTSRPKTVTLQLYQKVSGSDDDPAAYGDPVTVGLDEEGNALSGTTVVNENKWTYTWKGLPLKALADEGTVTYEYSFQETPVPDNYTAIMSEDGTTVTNVLAKQIRFVKEDMSGNKLDGAVFDLVIGNDTYTITSGTDGVMKTTEGQSEFTMLVSDTPYAATETTAPDGFNKLTGDVLVTVNQANVTAGRSDDKTVSYTVDEPTDENPYYVIHITNTAGQELPMTGGPGTLIYTLGGMLLMASAALMYGFRNKRAERRSK